MHCRMAIYGVVLEVSRVSLSIAAGRSCPSLEWWTVRRLPFPPAGYREIANIINGDTWVIPRSALGFRIYESGSYSR
jgi:hypothetical protein